MSGEPTTFYYIYYFEFITYIGVVAPSVELFILTVGVHALLTTKLYVLFGSKLVIVYVAPVKPVSAKVVPPSILRSQVPDA